MDMKNHKFLKFFDKNQKRVIKESFGWYNKIFNLKDNKKDERL